MLHPQLTLSIGTVPSSTFESFMPGSGNAEAYATLVAFCAGEVSAGEVNAGEVNAGEVKEKQIFLWGESASGKTHLLSAACQHFTSRGRQVAYMTGELASHSGALSAMESIDLLCLDDLHLMEPSAQETLFHCINRCRDSGTRLIFSSKVSIDELSFSLADLVTRLSWGPVFQLHTLTDEELPNALALQLQLRGLDVSTDVIEYIVRRYPRNMQDLTQLVDQLDQASLTEQRRITIPLVRSVSELMA